MKTATLKSNIIHVLKHKRLSKTQRARLISQIEAHLGKNNTPEETLALEIKTARENDSAIARKTHHRIKETTDAVFVVSRQLGEIKTLLERNLTKNAV